MNDNVKKHYIISTLIIIYLFIPLAATVLFSLATNWQTTLLPEGYTFKWYKLLLSDNRFITSLIRSIIASGVTVFFSILIMVPTVFLINVYFKRLLNILNVLCMLPFAIPPVVFAVGLIKVYSAGILSISGTIWILIAAFFVVILPFMFHGISNSIKSIDAKTLMEAAAILKANKVQTFIYIIFPNIIKGITVSALLSFSVLFGEFVLTNILVGGAFETVQIYLFNMRGKNGSLCSAIVIIYFIIILILTFLTTLIQKNNLHKGDAI